MTSEIVARAVSVRGEVVLRRRATGQGHVEELIVNGGFAMDSVETGSERGLGALAASARRVLLGGLGLGYTAAAVLAQPVERLDVVEIEDSLVDWARAGVTPVLSAVAADRRTHLHALDVAEALGGSAGPAGPFDAILLDVDNGPDFLLHQANAALYRAAGLASAYGRLADGGLLAIWCQGPAPELEEALGELGGTVEIQRHEAQRGTRTFDYFIYIVRRDTTETSGAD